MLGLLLIALGHQKAPETITFSEHIRPILAHKCSSCHQPQGPAPFSLLSYPDAKRRATLLRYVGMIRKMPPTFVDSDFGPISDHPQLSDQDVIYLQGWIRDGAPEGKPTEPISPRSAPFRSDQILVTRNAPSVRAEGAPYRAAFRVPLDLLKKRALRGFRVIPTHAQAVRQVSLAIADKTSAFEPQGVDSSRLIAAWAPGYAPWESAVGTNFEPGTDLEVQVLYQPTGKPENGNLKLELQWGEPTDTPVRWQRFGQRDFVLPPQDLFTHLAAEISLDQATQLRAIYPEARKYFNSLSVTATLPDGQTRQLLSLPRWDPSWVGAYNFPRPVPLPAGTKIQIDGYFNNSGHTFGEIRTTPGPVKSGAGPNDELFWTHLQFEPKA